MRTWICLFPFLLPPLLLNSMADHVAECDALLQFSNSFTISQYASREYCDYILTTFYREYSPASYPKTASWKNDTDCCWWDGVTCHPATNQVIGLDLSCSWLLGPLHSSSTLFSLTGLQNLNLAGNDFNSSRISPKFSIFTGMAHLNLSNSGFSGPVPLEMISHLSNLTILDLSYNGGFDGPLEIEEHSFRGLLHNLTRLRELALAGVDMYKVHPISLTNLSSTLTSLSLSDCYLQGVFPIDIFHLPNLQSLSLSRNDDFTGTLPQTNWTGPLVSLDLLRTNFHGSIPASIGNLTTMNYLDLSLCKFAGVLPPALGNLDHLTHLGISDTYFTGTIPPTFGNLHRLSSFEVDGNNLSGTVDFEMFARLKNLRFLSLSYNNLTVLLKGYGNCSFPRLQNLKLIDCKLTEFPYFLRYSTKLEELNISGNMISGTIPNWFWSVARDTLIILNLSSNNFTGYISSSICKLSSLEVLCLSSNRLNGTIPICLGNSSGIQELHLDQNLLQGPLPRSLANCLDMQDLDVSYNAIRDTFPNWIINASRGLHYLGLQSNGFHEVIEVPLPPWISELDLSNNNFSGYLPTDFLLNSSAQVIDLANNNFYGPLPIPPPTIVLYLLSNNKFGGRIPQHACNANRAYIIDLSNNSLIGTIPQCFKNISASLSVLDLRANKLTGQIPEIFIPKANMQTIRLSKNQFGGTLPHSLAHCEELEVLDLSENELEDRFPYWLDTLPNLQVLVLRSNKFYGPVDGSSRDGHPFLKLHIFDLSENSFSGPLPVKYLASLIAMKNEEKSGLHYMGNPDSYYQDSIEVVMKGGEFELVKILTVFMSIDFSSNFFEGEIPEVIGDLKALKGLNFSHNNLSGNIPASVGNLTNLEWLDFSSNKLNGMIPRGLANLASLEVLNLSNNQLTGLIPRSTQFDTFKHSFDGNQGLCGHLLPKLCRNDTGEAPPSTSHKEEETESGKWIEWRAVPMGYVCGLVVGISMGYIVLETRRPRWLARMIERKRSGKTRRPNKNISPRNHGRRNVRGH